MPTIKVVNLKDHPELKILVERARKKGAKSARPRHHGVDRPTSVPFATRG
jgi:hypothetical protein